MALSAEDKQEVVDLISASLSTEIKQIEDGLNRNINGAVKRVLTEAQGHTDKAVEKIGSTIAEIQSSSEKLPELLQAKIAEKLSEIEAIKGDEKTKGGKTKEGVQPQESEEVRQLQAQLKEMQDQQAVLKTNFEQQQQAAEAARGKAEQIEQQRAQDLLDSGLSTMIRAVPNIQTGVDEDLLMLLKERGGLVAKDGKYVIPGKDEYGMDVEVPVTSDVVNKLVADKYSYFLTPRPGGGTGGGAGSSTTSPTAQPPGSDKAALYFTNDGQLTDAARTAIAEGKGAEVYAVLG